MSMVPNAAPPRYVSAAAGRTPRTSWGATSPRNARSRSSRASSTRLPIPPRVASWPGRAPVDAAVTGRADHTLHQQVAGPGRDRAAPVRLLEAERHPRVAGLVQRDERHRQPASPFRVYGVRARRATVLRWGQPAHARVELL